MQALIKISDKQYLVKEGDKLFIPRQKAAVGETVAIDSIAKIDGENTVLTPAGSSIQAKVLDHVKDDKVVVFKKKRRKRYQSRNGHRQQMTQIEVVSL
ncbi:MAG: 50S ribosomal protein L21 [Chlorobiaceae bacterium]|nr:50S ribosomal protein L21 [Chlorobiaceae bacterium]